MPVSISVRSSVRPELQSATSNRVIGLDVSTNVGVVDFRNAAEVVAEEWNLGPATTFEERMKRLRELCSRLTQLCKSGLAGDVALLVIEGYAMGAKFIRSEQIELAAQARYVAWGLGVKVLEVTPSTLKKFVSGSGSAPKDKMMMNVLKRWQFEPATNNIADAYGLARIGRALIGLDKVSGDDAKVLAAIGKPKTSKKFEHKFKKQLTNPSNLLHFNP